jgi:hypothetical protein
MVVSSVCVQLFRLLVIDKCRPEAGKVLQQLQAERIDRTVSGPDCYRGVDPSPASRFAPASCTFSCVHRPHQRGGRTITRRCQTCIDSETLHLSLSNSTRSRAQWL